MPQVKLLNWGLMMIYATVLIVGFVVGAFLMAFYWSVGSIHRVEPKLADYSQNPSNALYLHPLSEKIVAAVRRDNARMGNLFDDEMVPAVTITAPTETAQISGQKTATQRPSATPNPTRTLTRTSSPEPTSTTTATITKTATRTAPAASATTKPTDSAPTRPAEPTDTRPAPNPSATQAPRPTQPPPTQPPPPTATRPPAPTATRDDPYPPPRPTDPPPTAYP